MESHRKTCVRHDAPGHAHALTFSCDERRPLLAGDAACRLLVESLAAARVRHGFDLWAYVIMPEHVHLLVWPRDPAYSISRILLAVKRPVSYQARRMGLAPGPRFWLAGGGFDRNIDHAAATHAEVQYMHANPVRRGLCHDPLEWKYSSAGFWAGRTDVPLAMDLTLPPGDG